MKKEKRLLRVGVLGCGPISQAAHLEASLKARNAELYAVCDLAEDLVQKIAARFEPRKTFTDYDAMLADPKVEAVVVAIADQFHVDAAIRALKAGKHVLVEKPLGTTIADCERLAAQVRDSKLIAQVGTMKRFDPGIRDAQRFLAEEGPARDPYGKVRQSLLDDNRRVRGWFRGAPRPDHARAHGLARWLSSLCRRGHCLRPHGQPLVLPVERGRVLFCKGRRGTEGPRRGCPLL